MTHGNSEVIRANPGGALERATPGDRQKWFRLVTPRTDDHGTRFVPMGGDLSVHRKNPVLLWGHGSGRNSIGDPPDPKHVIGRVVDYEQTKDHLDILAEFDTEDFAERIWQKVCKGLIRACSVGAKLLAPPETVKEGDREIPVFTKWLLRECSIVILGSNSEALALDRDAADAVLADMSYPRRIKSNREYVPHHVSSVGVFRSDGALLLGKRQDNGLWTTPGGHHNPGEDPEAAARRELREETGIEAPVSFLGSARAGDTIVHAYRANVGNNATPSGEDDPDQEVEEWRWVQRGGKEMDNLHSPRNVLLHLIGWQPGEGLEEVRPSDRPTPLVSRGAVAHQEYPTVDVPWDADQAKKRFARWASNDGSGDPDKVDWQKYRQCFAWFDDDKPSLSAGKLPHHDVRGGRVVTVWRAVMAASAALAGARGGVQIPAKDLPAVRDHLAAHMAEFDRDAEWVRQPPERSARKDPYRSINFDLAPGVASALRQGLQWQREGFGGPGLVESTMRDAARLVANGAWWPEKAISAANWFARHGALDNPNDEPADKSRPRTGPRRPTPAGVAWALWGGDAGREQATHLKREMEAADAAQEREDLAGLTGLGGSALAILQRDLAGMADPYLSQERTVSVGTPDIKKLSSSVVVADKEKTKMAKAKLSPENIAAIRGLISHNCDAAEMHARAHDMAPAELAGLKALHRDMAGKCLRDAEELHGAMREAHGAHFEPEGEVRAVPEFLRDEEIKRSFSVVYANIGRQLPSLLVVCRDELGEEDPGQVRAKITAYKDDSEELANVADKIARDAAAGTFARSEALISEALRAGNITPARALEMRGHDPKTYVSGASPTRARWSEEQIRSYLASRAGKAPLAEVRSADLRTPEGDLAGGGALIPPAQREVNRSSRVRMGSSPMENVDFASAAAQFAKVMREGDVPGQTRSGPSAEEIEEVARGMAEGRIGIPQRPGSEQVLTRFS